MRLVLTIFILTICISVTYSQCEDCEYLSENLVYNGDFELGDEGFNTNLSYGTGGASGILTSGSTYAIGPDANDFHVNFAGNDHTNPPDGNFMVINGSNVTDWPVWCQTIDVEPNQDYTMSFWTIDARADAPGLDIIFGLLQCSVDGVAIGDMIEVSDDWQQLTATWNSGANTSAEFCILNQQPSSNGNDYCLDDIELTTCLTYEIFQEPSAGEDLVLCHGDVATLGTDPLDDFSYDWEPNSFLASDDVASPTITVSNLGVDPITEVFTLYTDSAGLGCTQVDVVEVTIFPLPQPDLGDDVVICPGEETTLDAGAGWEEVLWSNDASTQTIVVDEVGVYTATVWLNGCENSDDVIVLMPDLPDIELGPDTSICEDGSFIFDAGVMGLWSTGEAQSFIETNVEDMYYFTYEDLGCTVVDSVFLDVIQYPVIELGDDFILCPDTFAILDIGYPGQWGDGTFDSTLVVDEPGFYSVIAADQQCSVYDAVTVIGLDYPEIDLGPDLTFCDTEEPIELGSDAEQNHHYLWSTGDTTNWVDIGVTHFVTVEVSNMCGSATDSTLIIYEDCGYSLFIPNAFTPDGDGLNETLEVFAHNFEYFEIVIFDRWGKMVFRSTDPEDQWMGDVMGGGYFAPNDTYFYRVQGQTIKKHIVQQNGWVTLIR